MKVRHIQNEAVFNYFLNIASLNCFIVELIYVFTIYIG